MFVNVSVTHHMLIPLRKTATKYKFIFNLIRAKCFLLHNVACIHALDCLCNSYIAKKKSCHLCVSQITHLSTSQARVASYPGSHQEPGYEAKARVVLKLLGTLQTTQVP